MINRQKKYYIINGKKIPFISGGKGCFAADTLISTPAGDIPIQNIQIGDEVYCFDEIGNLEIEKVTEIFYHPEDSVINVYYWGEKKPITVTHNHWFLNETNKFLEIGLFNVDDMMTTIDGDLVPITKIEIIQKNVATYNFTVNKYHTYIADGIRVHNKGGGGKGGTSEAENTLFSTDILFTTISLGEGPIYRINPNGPQDIEINDSSIDDLLLLNSGGVENGEVFHTETTTGTITQDKLEFFGDAVITPQNLAAPVILKKGNIPGIPASSVILQNTSVASIDEIRFLFNLNALQAMDDDGNVFGHRVAIQILVYQSNGTSLIKDVRKRIDGKTNVPFRFTVDVPINAIDVDPNGYKFTVKKINNEFNDSKIIDNIAFLGWQEIQKQEQAYPRTALIGYGLKAFGQYTGGVPNFTSMIKGLLCKVPTNYNQPTLEGGEIDWRNVEVSDSDRVANGYRLQKTGDTVLFDQNPIIYDGLWDGGFVFSYTQNPVWIVYDLLTNDTYGLGIPEENVDKFKFYKVAQYCDAINPSNGTFQGVSGIADGGYRYKPLGQFTSIRETLVGLSSGTAVKERRFITDISISSQLQVLEIISRITSTFRGIIFYSGGKISLNVDLPEDIPVAVFNETNIKKDSLVISGVRESELITGVEVSYIEPINHFKRDFVRIDDPELLKEKTQREEITTIELTGVTRRSQAIRYAQYLLASNKFIRRKIAFTTTIEAINVTVGDVVSISQRLPGTAWGYGGRVQANAEISNSYVYLEHYTSPSIGGNTFQANTLPVGLRVLGQNSDRVDLYTVSNTDFQLISTGNTITGADVVKVKILNTLDPSTKIFGNPTTFAANNVPFRGDIWTFGEINPNSFYENEVDKLFKITSLERDENEEISITGVEYVSNVYIDSDTIISYVPNRYEDAISPFSSPPVPDLELKPKLVRLADGSAINEIEVSVNYDFASYPLNLKTEYQHAVPQIFIDIEGII